MKRYNLATKGLSSNKLGNILGGQLESKGFKIIKEDTEAANQYTKIYKKDKIKVYTALSAFGDIIYNNKGEQDTSVPCIINSVFDHIAKDSSTDTRYCIPISEKRAKSSVGHFSLLVIDKKPGGSYKAVIFDSKTDQTFIAKTIRFFASALSISINSDKVIKRLLKESLGDKVTFERRYYHHQPSAFNNTCAAFTMHLLQDEALLAGNEPKIEKPNTTLLAATTFLTKEDLSHYEDIIKQHLEPTSSSDRAVASTDIDGSQDHIEEDWESLSYDDATKLERAPSDDWEEVSDDDIPRAGI